MAALRKIYFLLLDSLQTLLIAAAIFLVVYMFLFRPFQVKGDLRCLYPVAPDLYLVIGSAEENNVAVGHTSYHIAGPVQIVVCVAAECIVYKFFSGHFGLV